MKRDREKEKLINKLKKGVSVRCKMGPNNYVLEGYNIFETIDLLGMNGANAKPKKMLDELLHKQLKRKVEDTGIKGKVLANSDGGITFQFDEIYNKLFAFGIIEFLYNENDDVEKIKLTDTGIDLYKERKRCF